ncbi:Protein CBR-SRX-42 [Caenorhabditis briggsae]|uniref:G-protein coupled receptors family 1 profile domain-containing protein n=2 Tax=Caenorhabditis briggsae TaxID=6238 RepID=A0AAE9CXS5_CAEBR|nr:Protein CBR-SRX-42 [Caenorhabditis briggsae]ULT85888.1 hypothetical protein L3Y34_005935 [Caenorhabditis briggsae]CAP30529.2 Protein CBR-SRX-42 [Caenorhabditis briggsae]
MSPTINSYEDILAGSIVSVICTIGNVMMVLVIIGSTRIPSMKSSFGMLTINQNFAEIVPCTTGFTVFFFGYALGLKTMIEYSYLVGGSAITMLMIILVGFLLISLNRLCAIIFPIAYNTIFKGKFILTIIVITWILPILVCTYIFAFRQCTYAIVHEGWYFNEYPNEKCGSVMAMYQAIQTPLALFISFIDLTTLVLLIILRNRIFKTKSSEARRREMNFARQVLVQGFVFTMHGFWYASGRELMPPTLSENWKIFWTTSFSSNLLHVFDPMIVFICNMEFRTWIFGLNRNKKNKRIVSIVGSTSMN